MKKLAIFATLLCSVGAAYSQSTYGPCILEIAKRESLAPLAPKMALGGFSTRTFEMLANATYPSEEERPLIAEWANAREACFNNDKHMRSTLPPIGRALVERLHNDVLAAAADLYANKITYGDFAKRRDALGAAFEADWDRAKSQYEQEQHANVRAQQAQDEQRRQAAAALLLGSMPRSAPTMPQPYQIPTGTNTRCTMYGNQVDCNTR